jgi:hypothetical protein
MKDTSLIPRRALMAMAEASVYKTEFTWTLVLIRHLSCLLKSRRKILSLAGLASLEMLSCRREASVYHLRLVIKHGKVQVELTGWGGCEGRGPVHYILCICSRFFFNFRSFDVRLPTSWCTCKTLHFFFWNRRSFLGFHKYQSVIMILWK